MRAILGKWPTTGQSGVGQSRDRALTGCGKWVTLGKVFYSVTQARSSARLERFLDTEEVDGSSPFGPTIFVNNPAP